MSSCRTLKILNFFANFFRAFSHYFFPTFFFVTILVCTDTDKKKKNSSSFLDSENSGFLCLYQNRPQNDENDGISWDEEKRQMLKLIMLDEKNIYKVKNNKSADGVSVMRRQVWRSSVEGWMKHEFKIFKRFFL